MSRTWLEWLWPAVRTCRDTTSIDWSAAVGEPPGAFRRRLLLERAAHRLMSTADAVIDVGFDAGYAAPEAFARAFARTFGASPSDFRRRRDVGYELPAPNGIHFYPPGERRPARTRLVKDVRLAGTSRRVSEGTRTPDRLDHNQELYQLSYAHRGIVESTSVTPVPDYWPWL